jgi:hypothetical protein
MNLQVRSLNSNGVAAFSSWLVEGKGDAPIEILDDPQFFDEIVDRYAVDPTRTFNTSYELGKYLHESVFVDVTDVARLSAETGVWAWISLVFIDSLLARSTARKGKPLSLPHYVEVDSQHGRRLAYRLIARTAWKLVRAHGVAAEIALGSSKSPWGEMAEQMTSRQEVFSHPSFWSVASRLYRSSNGEIRRGATSQRPEIARRDPKNSAGRGGVRRLPMTFRQFDRTYNVRRMSLEDMLAVLPDEYSKWIAA